MEQLIGFAQYVSDDGEAMVKFLFVFYVLEDSSSPMLRQSLNAFLITWTNVNLTFRR